MIRLLTVQELPMAAQLGPQFYAEGKLPGKFVPEVFAAKWTELMELGMGFILGLFDGPKLAGVFGAVVAGDVNDGEMTANEMFWFVRPESRGRGLSLMSAYEAEARKRGAKRCSMIHLLELQPEKLADLYERRGYRAVETAYHKELT